LPVVSSPGLRPNLADGDADRGGDLDDAVLVGIAQGVPRLGGLVVLVDGADGAVRGALAALDAGRLGERGARGGGHARLLAAADVLEGPDILHLLADLGAAAALDALHRVEDDGGRGGVDRGDEHFLLEGIVADAEVGGELLELAVPGARALEAVVRVVREDELEDRTAHADDVGVVRRDLHALGGLRAAGAEELRRTGVPDDADAARGGRLEVRMEAEGRDLDVGEGRGLEDGGAIRDFDGNAVDLEMDLVGLDGSGHGFSFPF